MPDAAGEGGGGVRGEERTSRAAGDATQRSAHAPSRSGTRAGNATRKPEPGRAQGGGWGGCSGAGEAEAAAPGGGFVYPGEEV